MSSNESPADDVSFWNSVGSSFPSLKGAPSTAYYAECERLLFATFFPRLSNRRILKTDLWDEAKNTEILLWAAEQGARPAGVDIAFDTVQQAKTTMGGYCPAFAVADVRALPFQAETFDLIYSMGTIEHFQEHETAVRQMFRVLKPKGVAIIGVPNRCDPFLRPLMVWGLQRIGRYAYGLERSFTPGQLKGLVESAGFIVTGLTGILFMPGWLRMLDLLFHTRFPRLTALTRWGIRPFAWLYRRVPWLRRHGYLIAVVVEKPALKGSHLRRTDSACSSPLRALPT